jgi:hypothetical protein
MLVRFAMQVASREFYRGRISHSSRLLRLPWRAGGSLAFQSGHVVDSVLTGIETMVALGSQIQLRDVIVLWYRDTTSPFWTLLACCFGRL